MIAIRREPCSACPYRLDCPSGLWSADEYDKLTLYDAPTGEQPFNGFACHATSEFYCHGWAVVHTSRGSEFDLLALRIYAPAEEIPEPAVPLFSSGQEAAEHGRRDIKAPSTETSEVARRLLRKYARLDLG